ncbi:MAG: CinA family protein [Oscillospiraceae bacterium]
MIEASLLISRLKNKNLTLCCAESLTGGLFGGAITSVNGSSAVFKGGIISYTNEIKNKVLNVPIEELNTFGAVSKEVCISMAKGVKSIFNTDIAVSVTGLAGPTLDEKGNPVGTVFMCIYFKNNIVCKKIKFYGNRKSIREQVVKSLLKKLNEIVDNMDIDRL